MNICIFGGAGFIGSHIADRLLALGHHVIIIDDLSTGRIENVPEKATFIQRDITEDISDIFRMYKPEYVYHLAAQVDLRYSLVHPANDAKINIMGSLNIIERCVEYGVKKIIFSSTGGALYQGPLPWNESSEIFPKSPYGLAKKTVESYLEIANRTYGLEYVALRYSNVYGSRQNLHGLGEAGVISIFVQKALKNQEIIIYGDGDQTRDFINVQSVVFSNELSLNDDVCGIYNVGSGESVSVNTITKMILDNISETTSQVKYLNAIPGEVMHTKLSCKKLERTGWKCDIEFEDGLRETIKWFRENIRN